MQIVAVNFPNSTKPYYYYCPFMEVVQGDTVFTPTGPAKVIHAARTIHGELPPYKMLVGTPARGKTANIYVSPTPPPSSRTVGDTRKQVEDLARRLKLRAEMHLLVKEYTALARRDKAAAKLLKELKELLK